MEAGERAAGWPDRTAVISRESIVPAGSCGRKTSRQGLGDGVRSRLGHRLLLNILQHHLAHLLAAHQLAAGLHDVAGAVARVQGGGDGSLQPVGHLQARVWGGTTRWAGVRPNGAGAAGAGGRPPEPGSGAGRQAGPGSRALAQARARARPRVRPTLGRLRPKRHIMAADSTMASGLALSWPAMSGAEPCTWGEGGQGDGERAREALKGGTRVQARRGLSGRTAGAGGRPLPACRCGRPRTAQ